MFRELKRINQHLTKEEIIQIFNKRTNGVLATLGDDDYPYAVPISFVYLNHKIYFHSSANGHKIDAIKKHPKVSFTVVDEDTIIPELYTSFFRSVHVFGKARILDSNSTEWFEGFKALNDKYCYILPQQQIIDKIKSAPYTAMVAIDIEHMTGKEASSYAKEKHPERYTKKDSYDE